MVAKAVLRQGCFLAWLFCSLGTDRTRCIVNPDRSHGSCDVEKQLAQDSDAVFPRFNLAFVLGANKTELEWQGGSSIQAGVVDSLGDGEVSETSICLTTQR